MKHSGSNPRRVVVMLAGTMRSSSLRSGLDIPALALPMGGGDTLLHLWQQRLCSAGLGVDMRIIVSTPAEVDAIAAMPASDAFAQDTSAHQRIIAEPAQWRGTGGIVFDVTEDLDDDTVVLVIEGRCLPVASLEPLLKPLEGDDVGLVGTCGDDTPAGLYALTRKAIARVPRIGYRDLKEQLLPQLHKNNLAVRTARVGDRLHRIRDRRSYLDAIAVRYADQRASTWISPQAQVSSSAILDGCCLVEAGAVVEDGAVVHDSVILAGATVGGGAVLSRCIVAPNSAVAARSSWVRQVVSTEQATVPVPVPEAVVS